MTPTDSPQPLEPSPEEMRLLVAAALDRIVDHVAALPAQPASDLDGAVEMARALSGPLPSAGAPFEEILDLLFDRAAPKSLNTAGPGYLAYIPGGGLFASAVADLIGDSLNRYVGVFAAAPALAQLEADVVSWFAGLVGLPATAGGFLTSGGSRANLSAVVTARRERLPADFLRGTLYASEQTHHSVAKAALLAGFPPERVRRVDTDTAFRLRPDHLEGQIEEDRRQGLIPFLVAANAGTTNSGAVDPLPEIADVAAREGLWLHVDAAYGGFFLLTGRGRRTLRGIERADSVTLDPHKGLFLPYGTGALVVRDAATLRRAHSLAADYMPPIQDEPDLVDFCELSPELSRPFRGLRVWLPFKLYGAAAFTAALDEKLDLTCWATEELRQMPGIEILAEPQLSIVAFRAVPSGVHSDAGLSDADLDALNQDFLDRINARKRVYLTATRLGGRFALRLCILSFRTHRDRMEACLADIRAALAEIGGPRQARYP